MKSSFFISLCLVFTFSCKQAKKNTSFVEDNITQQRNELRMLLEPKNESGVNGEVIFTQSEGTVKMSATLEGLSEGSHAIHIHEKSDCSSEDGKSAGGHWNPTAQPHGRWGAKTGYHKGDIGNFDVDKNETTAFTFETNEWCIGCDDPSKDILGKAIIVHQGKDDFTSQPSGAAGSRVSCGGIIQ
jgi:Cu-Zn family superoxide dismutase